MSPDSYVLPSSDSESLRLDHQARLYGGTAFLQEAVAARPSRVLEVGCGTSVFAAWVAEQLPEAQVVGLDMDEARLAHARRVHPRGNLRLVQGDMGELPFEDGSFDLVYARFALLHQVDLDPVLAELVRVLAPGGTLLALEMVHDGIWLSPPRPGFKAVMARTLEVMASMGVEPDQGVHVPGAMVRAGLHPVQAQTLPFTLTPARADWRLWMDNWAQTISELGDILGADFDAEALARAVEELRDDRPDQLLVEITVRSVGRCPQEAPRA